MSEQEILNDYGYNRVNNICISKSIEEDFLYFISDKDTILHFVDLYLSNCYGSEYTKEVSTHLSNIYYQLHFTNNVNSLMTALINLIIDTVHADSCKKYKRNILNRVEIYNIVKSYREELINTVKGYFQ